MTIIAYGAISLGVNATITRSVACELGLGGTTQICMDQTAVRALAAQTGAGSAICFSNFYGRTAAPGSLGSVYKGGYYIGSVASPANYYLVVAPNASGCASCAWRIPGETLSPGAGSTTDGYANTYNGLANANHPAGNFTATRSINGFTDWYLPAVNEQILLFTNKGSMPAGQGFASPGNYWSSTEFDFVEACYTSFANGFCFRTNKTSNRCTRAIRRVSF